MAPKAEDFILNRLLKAIDQRDRDDHHGYTDGGGDDGYAQNESRETALRTPSDSPG
jgi:hypothetical protein